MIDVGYGAKAEVFVEVLLNIRVLLTKGYMHHDRALTMP